MRTWFSLGSGEDDRKPPLPTTSSSSSSLLSDWNSYASSKVSEESSGSLGVFDLESAVRFNTQKSTHPHPTFSAMAETITSTATNRYAVVTGSNKGIGFEICRQLASNGITVALTARDVKKGTEAFEKLKESGFTDRVVFHQLDVTNPSSVASLADFVNTHFGRLDILIVELWTKRNFRCDCGNSKFGEFFCKLFANKEVENADNAYNHNFKGLYCKCGHPYPDPEAEEQVEMIQCCICEDWFHEEHIGLESSDEIPRDEEGEPLYEDFICQSCSEVCSFLALYPQTIRAVKQHDATNATKDKNVLEDTPSACGSSEKLEAGICSSESAKVNFVLPTATSEMMSDGKGMLIGETSDKKPDSNELVEGSGPNTGCVLGVDVDVALPVLEKTKPMFLSKNWRDVLCRCEKCANFCTQKGIGFLLDKEDTIAEYEKMAKQKRDEKLQQQDGVELNFLNNLGHVEKMEILNGITDMKNEIHTFLESFDTSKPITSEDVHQVFENLAKKRRRT